MNEKSDQTNNSFSYTRVKMSICVKWCDKYERTQLNSGLNTDRHRVRVFCVSSENLKYGITSPVFYREYTQSIVYSPDGRSDFRRLKPIVASNSSSDTQTQPVTFLFDDILDAYINETHPTTCYVVFPYNSYDITQQQHEYSTLVFVERYAYLYCFSTTHYKKWEFARPNDVNRSRHLLPTFKVLKWTYGKPEFFIDITPFKFTFPAVHQLIQHQELLMKKCVTLLLEPWLPRDIARIVADFTHFTPLFFRAKREENNSPHV